MTAEKAEDKRIRQQASEWVADLAAPHADEAMTAAFERWYRADPRHADAFEHASRVFSSIVAIDDPELLALADPSTYRPGAMAQVKAWLIIGSGWRRALTVATGAVAAIGVAWVVGLSVLDGTGVQEYQTSVAEIRDIELEDGSVVTLGARSRIEVNYSADARRVTLGDGQAFFSVEKDTNRPFIVRSNGTQIQVTGSKFNVHKGPAGLRVAVEEGVVEVSVQPKQPTGPKAASFETVQRTSAANNPLVNKPAETVVPKAIVSAGEQVISTNDGELSKIKSTDAAVPPNAWRSGRLIYSDARLAELVADVSRYFDGTITLESEAVGDIRFSGVFFTSDVNRLIENLPQYLPVEADYQGDRKIVIRLRQADEPNG